MDFWIRTQDKECLTKVNHLYIYNCDIKQQNDITLGIYKTKERALEVLNEIHQRLIDLQTIEYLGDYRFTKRNLDCVYEMPKE